MPLTTTRYASFSWSHCFVGSVVTDLTLVVDTDAPRLVRGHTSNSRALEAHELADVAESLFADYNADAYTDALEGAVMGESPDVFAVRSAPRP
jgi:hypothetical protein